MLMIRQTHLKRPSTDFFVALDFFLIVTPPITDLSVFMSISNDHSFALVINCLLCCSLLSG